MTKLSNKALAMKFYLPNILPFLAVVLLAPVSSCNSEKKEAAKAAAAKSNKPKVILAEAYVVKPQSFSNTYTASGSLLPNEEVEVHPEMAGRVTGIGFKEGTVVHKGQLLVQLFDGDLRAQLQRLQAQKQLQTSTENRQRALLNIGGISRQDFEATQAQTQYVNSDIAVAQAGIGKMRILAPFDGTIGLRNISIGAVVSPTTTVATLQQIHTLKMDFTMPDQYRNQVRIGGEVHFSVDNNQQVMKGKISAMDPGADPVTRTLRIRALVPNEQRLLSAGAFAHVMVPLETNNNAILIPPQSIIPTTRDKKVAVVHNGKADLVTVVMGSRTADRIEIVSGLKAGDTVLTTALMQVKPKMEVKVKKLVQ